jgi:hypothetical protein
MPERQLLELIKDDLLLLRAFLQGGNRGDEQGFTPDQSE